MEKTISARVELNDYANRVLGIIKIKFGLKDKSEALNKFIELYGGETMEKKVSDEYVKKVVEIAKRHFDQYKNKKMGLKELDNLCEM
ncbi:MAG: antitoxin [Minisyncoccales bacterium]